MLISASRIAGELTKGAGLITGTLNTLGKGGELLGRGLFGPAEWAKKNPRKSLGRAVGIAGGTAIAGGGLASGMKDATKDMSELGFAQRMGYGG